MQKLHFTLLCFMLSSPTMLGADEPIVIQPNEVILQLIQVQNDDETPVFSRNASTHLIDANQHILAIKDNNPFQFNVNVIKVNAVPGQAVAWELAFPHNELVLRAPTEKTREENNATLLKTLEWQREIQDLLDAAP